jgi:undecaprenyl pyrophosphate synthase
MTKDELIDCIRELTQDQTMTPESLSRLSEEELSTYLDRLMTEPDLEGAWS